MCFRLHSWGDSLEEAYEQCAMAMFGYMTDTETVEPIDTIEIESEGEKVCVCEIEDVLCFHYTVREPIYCRCHFQEPNL